VIDAERLIALDASGDRAVVLTVLEGPRVGAKALVLLAGDRAVEGDADLPGLGELAERAAGLTRSGVLVHDGVRVLADLHGPSTTLVVLGAYDVGEELCAQAHRLGWRAVVIDARERYATPERLPSADELIVAWPEEGLARVAPDASTAVVVLTHDHKFDVPALRAAVRTPAFYVGALGSRRNQARRHPRLLEAGLTEAEIARIAAPSGLDLGGETPAETALSIAAEIVARRNGRAGGPLRSGSGPIHDVDPPPDAVGLGTDGPADAPAVGADAS
jgi:xanthine dehydrogenase accessory factor